MTSNSHTDTQPHYIEALQNQTVRVDRLIVHRNDSWQDGIFKGVSWVKSSSNVGVYRRFCIGLDLDTDFLLYFDDDTIPGERYVESLINLHADEPALYSAAGFKINHKNYADRLAFGWPNPAMTRQKVRVDWPGHSWFCHKDIVVESYKIPRWESHLCGEDMRLAFAAQRLGFYSYVTPYPEDQAFWGSTRGVLGTDEHATYRLIGQKKNMNDAMTFYRSFGWKFLSE